jgi:hypothetical protein
MQVVSVALVPARRPDPRWQPEERAILARLAAARAAAEQPRTELVRESVGIVASLRRQRLLTDKQATEILTLVAAANIQAFVSEAIASRLGPMQPTKARRMVQAKLLRSKLYRSR